MSLESTDVTLVMPVATLSAAPPPKDPRAPRVLLEATLAWAGEPLAIAHVRPRRALRARDLGLQLGPEGEIVVASIFDGEAALVLPNGARVPAGSRMAVRLGRATLSLALVDDDAPALPRAPADGRLAGGVLGAAALHLAVVALLAHGRGSAAEGEANALATMARYVASAEERAHAEVAAAATKPELTGDGVATSKQPDEGAAGSISHANDARARVTNGADRRAVIPSGPEIETFGMLGLLNADGGTNAGASPFAEAIGPSAMGNLFGDTIDDAIGVGGLGLSGIGEGGGGLGAGVPLERAGALFGGIPAPNGGGLGVGHGGGGLGVGRGGGGRGEVIGLGEASGFGCGCGSGFAQHAHVTRAPTIRTTAMSMNGRLPPEAIQRVVHESFGRMRGCYTEGLVHDPTLEGRVTVKFVIDREGQVTLATADDRTLPSESVAACVARAFHVLSFPKPEGGIVTVVYPIVFSPA